MKVTEWQAREVARWWANRLHAPRFDAGCDSPEMRLAQALQAKIADEHPASDEAVALFERELAALLVGSAPPNAWSTDVVLRTDYHPEGALVEAARKAGVPDHLFPTKTITWCHPDGSYSTKLGYAGERVHVQP